MATCRSCDCTDETPCPGGCYWVDPDLCSSCVPLSELTRRSMADSAMPLDLTAESLAQVVGIEAPFHTWLGVHGALCLALRHPQFDSGPAREAVEILVESLEGGFVEHGVLSAEEVALLRNTEQHERALAFQVMGTDRLFITSRAPGAPELCSRCMKPIAEDEVPVRVSEVEGEAGEYRYHPACVGLQGATAQRVVRAHAEGS